MAENKKPTREDYIKAAAFFRLLQGIWNSDVTLTAASVLKTKDGDRFLHHLRQAVGYWAWAETRFFTDYPERFADELQIFNGNLNTKPLGDNDAEVIRIAKEIADSLFEKKEAHDGEKL